MGNPRRFLGTGEVYEVDGIEIPPHCAVEVTFRTHQQQFLLRPDEEANEIILGCFGRAYSRYPDLNVHVLDVKSNHGSFVATPSSAYVLSRFMQDFLSDSARRLNRHRDREGTFWERRYRAIPIVDEAALEDRFRYVLTQGTKENLVESASDWPGITSAHALLGGPGLVGRWRCRTRESELARQRQRKLDRAVGAGRTVELPPEPQVWYEYPIELHPLPHWAALEPGQRRALVARILAEDAAAARARHEREGTRPLGVALVLATDPLDRPAKPKKSPAPACHASSRARRKAYRVVYKLFLEALDASRARVEEVLPTAYMPFGATLPPLRLEPPIRPGRSAPSSSIGPLLAYSPAG